MATNKDVIAEAAAHGATTAVSAALEMSVELRSQMAGIYYKLCDERDAAYARAAPLEKKLAQACEATNAARAVEMDLAAQVEKAWGPNHLAIKKEIANIARALVKIPPRPGTEAPAEAKAQ